MILKQGPFCATCQKTNKQEDDSKDKGGGQSIKNCSRCSVVKYCSKKCQREDYTNGHKEACAKIEKHKKEADDLTEKLKAVPVGNNKVENAFETRVGRFSEQMASSIGGKDFQPKEYLKAKFGLAQQIMALAEKHEDRDLYERLCRDLLEIKRLDHTDVLGVRSILPFVLLILGRDNDCYGFIKWHLSRDENYDWSNPPNASKGEWTYLKDEDKAEDVFEQIPEVNRDRTELAFLLALIGIKMRILNDLEGTEKKFRTFKDKLDNSPNGSVGKELSGCELSMDCLMLYMMGDRKVHKEESRRQEVLLKKYLKMVQKVNKGMLNAILNPDPVLKNPKPATVAPGSADEVRNVLEFCCKFFSKACPGAQKRIKLFMES